MPYHDLLTAIATDLGPIVDEVVADVSAGGPVDVATRDRVRASVERFVAVLAAGPGISARDLDRLRAEGAAAARDGEPVAAPIDRYLSTGWAIWDAATHDPAAGAFALAALGSALLRTGDAAAAAIADGHGTVEAEAAGRRGAARRALADDLLALDPADGPAVARLAARAATMGLALEEGVEVVVIWLGHSIEPDAPEVDALAHALEPAQRPPRRTPTAGGGTGGRPDARPLVVARDGRIVALVPSGRVDRPGLGVLLSAVAGAGRLLAVRSERVSGAGAVAEAAAEASAALDVALGVGSSGVIDVRSVALERAMLADPRLLRTAVDRELGPLLRAPRNGPALVATLRAWLDHRQNLQATARALGVAPRTVAYRLERIEGLTGSVLDGPMVRRSAAALLALDLLGGP